MTLIPFPLGSQIRITGTFTNLLTNVLADPTVATLYIARPGQAAVAFTTLNGVVKDGVGLYHYDLTLDQPGAWSRAWVGTGAIVAAELDQEIPVANSRLH